MKPRAALETEVKLRVPDTGSLRPRLAALGFVEGEPSQPEESVLWDREGELMGRGCALRVRRYAGKAWLTFKGPRRDHPELKIRPEHETRIEDPEDLERILDALGYRPVLRMEKSRSMWHAGGLVACLDDTPLGRFLELEGEADLIRQAMASLGIGRDAIEPRSYATLYREAGIA